jgi:signal transduction histidine kinase
MKRHICLIILSIVISIFHYFTPTSLHHWHNIYQRLYYLPIIQAAYFFGLRLGLGYALLCGLLYVPHIFFQWSFSPHHSFTQYVEISMFFIIAALVGFLREIQKRQEQKILKQQEDLFRADRLSLLGKLAAGLAHEIKNPLAGLLGSAEILRKDMGEGHPKAEFAHIIETELKRLNRKLNEFLSFARVKPLELLPNNLNDIIEATLTILASQLERLNISMEKNLNPDLPLVSMDAEQMKQVVLNLMLNGIEAMPAGGRLGISTAVNENMLEIQISDNGPGIPPAIIDKIFDPFFTKKPKGTGLGLAVAKQIIDRHKGDITVESGKKGTQFLLRIPYGES